VELETFIDEPATTPRYVIGIDLGTTNSAVAYVDLEAGDAAEQRKAHVFAVPQLVAPGELAARPMLPSFLYLPGAHELPPGSAALPWDEARPYLVGQAALEQGARVPGRLIASAKSWLSHAAVDRTAPILPWGAAAEVAKVSPVEASKRYLQHIREAWDATMAGGHDENMFARQAIVLTVPASFDEVARELTMRAAEEAGLAHAVLLEEPLAAFYAWLADHQADWQSQLREGQLILVCDVGGGTSDFTIVGVRRGEAGLRFDRLAVGEHLMLGGDNMDMALGRLVETQLLGQPGKLDTQRWQQLVYAGRRAKETLLGDEHAADVDVTVLGSSGRVIGGALSGKLSRADVLELLVDGFFPVAPLDSAPAVRRSGLTELGLPFVADPAITHHLAAFWRRFETLLRQETGRDAPYPDWLLFNGGTLTPRPIRERLTEVVQHWFAPIAGSGWQPGELPNPRPELAVALGAAYYGVVRLGQGVRVGSGSPRAFYVAVDAAAAASSSELHTAVCLVPRGTEEGFHTRLDEPAFVALTNQPVSFQLFTSSTRLGDRLGDVVQLHSDEVTTLPPIRSVLRYGRGVVNSIPVRLEVRLTEVGTLELWCRAQESEHRWRLQFDLRREAVAAPAASAPQSTIDEADLERAHERIRSTFIDKNAPPEHTPAALRAALEQILGLGRDKWPAQAIRRLAQALLECQAGRTRSAEHETRWLNLLGFCMRPGYGDIGDEVRMAQLWKLYLQGLAFPKELQCRNEWWVLWRRVAGGLSSGRQQHIFTQIWPYLEGGKPGKQKQTFPKSLRPGEDLEIWMTLASFEWLQAETKVEIGRRLLARAAKRAPSARELWALGRLGNRTALYGSLDRLIPAAEASSWLETLLRMGLPASENLGYCLVLLAQYTGDRGRDVPEPIREQVARALRELPNAQRLTEWLTDPQRHLERAEESWMLGESLPSGLQLFAPALERQGGDT